MERTEIYQVNERESSLEIAGNKVTSLRKKDITKKGVRLFQRGKIASASYVGAVADEFLIAEAQKNFSVATTFDYELPEVHQISSSIKLKGQAEQEFLESYQLVLEKLTRDFPEFFFSGKANFKLTNKSLKIDGVNLQNDFEAVEWYFLYRHKKSASIIDGFLGANTTGSFDVEAELTRYLPYLQSFEKNVELRPGKIPVVFFTPELLFKKIAETARADHYYKGLGLFKGKLEEQVLSEKFSLHDLSFDPKRGAANLFDGEGHVREQSELPIYEKGIFKNLICDLRNAHRYQLKPTGNAQRAYNSGPTLGFNTLTLQPGERRTQEILKSLPRCLVVEMAAGGDFTDLGDYSTPVQSGYLVEFGEVMGKVPQVTLTSSVQEMFGNDLLEIGADSLSGLSHCPAIFSEMNVLGN